MIEMNKGQRGVAVVVGLCLSIILVNGAPHHTSKAIDCESGHPADVIFLLDASNSIWRPDFIRQIAFIKELSRMFRIGPSHTQIAVITYAEYPQFQFHLNYYSKKSDILAAIDSIRQMGGYHTSTPDALRTMRERGFNRVSGARANVTRVGIVITDGNSDEPEKTIAEAQKVKDAGIHLFGVGVGLTLDLSELEAIASPPSKYYTFSVDSYAGLDNIKELLAIKACTVTDPPTTPSTTTVATTWTTTPTTQATVAPSTEDPLSRRTPELEGPRSTSDEELSVHQGTEREEAVEEFQGSIRQKPETGHENDPTDSKTSGGPDEEDELNRRGNGSKHHHKSGWDRSNDEERTLGGGGRPGKHPGQSEVDGTQGTPSGNDFLEYDDVLKQWRLKKGRDWSEARQDGAWVRDRDGRTIWVAKPEVTPVNGTLVPTPGLGVDYEVDQVNPGESGKDLSKDKRKPIHSGVRKEGSGNGKENGKPGHNGNNKHTNGKRRHEVCRPKTPLDVVFIIDPKTRDRRHRRHLLETVRNAVDHIDMDNGQMRVQFVQSCPKSDRHRNLSNKASLLNALDEVVTPPQRSTADLFHAMTTKLTTNGRPGRKRIGVYLTNGPSGDLEQTLEAVQEAKNDHDVEMFTVGLGRDLNPVELKAISSCEVSKHMFTARNNAKTKELAKQLTKSLCSVR